jgi:hypothetical protein
VVLSRRQAGDGNIAVGLRILVDMRRRQEEVRRETERGPVKYAIVQL